MDVRVINRLTSSWLSAEGAGVVSGAGAWPLLAVLASSADEPGRSELAQAVGLPADQCMEAARAVLKLIGGADGVDAALGLWAHAAAQIDPDWAAQLPVAGVGELTGDAAVDQPKLDAWARENTRDLIERFPVDTDPDMMLMLASALAVRTEWTRRFSDEHLVPRSGPWAKQRIAGLTRSWPELDDVVVARTEAAGPLTLTRVEGDNGIDVHLVLGDEQRTGHEVLPAAIDALAGELELTAGSSLLEAADAGARPAPGLEVVPAQKRGVSMTTVRFTVRSDHDLMAHAALFGLDTVRRRDKGHFSRIGPVPLHVDQARQSAVAIFSATGFEAAAVTAIGMRMVSMPMRKERGLQVTYDRPFGFLAVHRDSGLVLFAGWVQTAEPARR
ncbi:serpin family protein [Phytoactinopolyspora halotolerans]|uniref:Serpin domain-containing protein n=1 Tax=Phytoactinopolyspora halotolerans TaxID=1981512 RepID=A0A6L9S370_9ACTN|nr:serpin family protein [Phytoactinopolyspora halotolerans]NED99073.1 hypothetical protein [Phytoactinopolyspora halotolerans]